MTLNEMTYDILNEARNNQIAESEKISTRQIWLWIKTYRAYLVKQKIDKGEVLDEMFYQTIRMHLDKTEDDPGHIEYLGDKELPTLLGTKLSTTVITVKDAYGNLIQLGNETKMKYQKYRKYTCSHYIAYVKDRHVYVEGDANQLEYIDVEVLAEDPTDEKACYNPDKDEYPLPAYMWPTIKKLILSTDIPTMLSAASDTTNNSSDDTQHGFISASSKAKKKSSSDD